MPWDCKSCGTLVSQDDQPKCPQCGTDKTAWTVVADKTRAFQVTRRSQKVQYLRGESDASLPADGAAYAGLPVVEIEEAIAVPKKKVRRLMEQGKLPAPSQILIVRMHPRKKKKKADLTVYLAPQYESKPTRELTFPQPDEPELDTAGALDVRFVFVEGPESVDEMDLPGLSVVDVTEETQRGFALQVAVRAMTKKHRDLPIRQVKPVYHYSM